MSIKTLISFFFIWVRDENPLCRALSDEGCSQIKTERDYWTLSYFSPDSWKNVNIWRNICKHKLRERGLIRADSGGGGGSDLARDRWCQKPQWRCHADKLFKGAIYTHVLLLKWAALPTLSLQLRRRMPLNYGFSNKLWTRHYSSICQAESRKETVRKNQHVRRCHTQPYGDLKINFDMIIPHSFDC